MIEKATEFIELHYKEFSSMSWVYSCGAGANYGTALESALKTGGKPFIFQVAVTKLKNIFMVRIYN